MVYGVWCMVYGVWNVGYGVWCMVYGVWCMVYGVWYVVYGVWCMVYGVWCMVYGVWCMVYGVWCLYKGMGAPLVVVVPIFAVSFFGFGLGKKLQQKDGEELGVLELAAAGAVSGIMASTLMGRGERIKCLLQVQQNAAGSTKYSGPIDVVRCLYKEGGVRSIFRGTAATTIREIPA